MSMTILFPSDPLTWKQADADVHVATRAGEFAGFVEFDGITHLAHDSRGTALGSYESLDDARAALDSASAIGRRTEASGFRLPRPLRRRPRRARA